MKKKKVTDTNSLNMIPNDSDKLKKYISECEERYHASFKTKSCKAIMDAYYEWQRAKKKYYSTSGAAKQQEYSMDSLIKDAIKDAEKEMNENF